MKKQLKTLTPKLRFPEFRDGPGWAEKAFADLYTFKPTNTLSRDKLSYDGGTVRNIHYGDIHTRFQTLFDLQREVVPYVTNGSADDFRGDAFCTEGDLVFADASEDLNDVGKSIEIVALRGERVLSGTHTILAMRRDAQLVVGFGGYLFRSERIREKIRREAQGSKVYGISSGRLASISVCFPATESEQRKIAACLTSLDERIAAEGRKLETLRAHKKGLMQQLFPREGESHPRLRFPEFRDVQEWEEKKLDELAKRGTGHTPNKAVAEYYNGRVKWISLADSFRLDRGLISETAIEISEQGIDNSSAVLHPAGTVVLSRDAGVGKSGIMSLSMAVSQHFVTWTCRDQRLSNWFLYYVLQQLKPELERIATGSTIKTIGMPFFAAMRITVPQFAEQQRIAACLSSLDALIAAQARKLDSLRTHKKGLMQQLFPSPKVHDV